MESAKRWLNQGWQFRHSVPAKGLPFNAGTIAGQGTVSALINDTTGVVRAEGGQLTLAGAVSNAAGGQIEASSGATALFVQGLATNSGTIALSGGTFDNNNQPLTNNAALSGNGTIRTLMSWETSLFTHQR
jgi:hypothetical protein